MTRSDLLFIIVRILNCSHPHRFVGISLVPGFYLNTKYPHIKMSLFSSLALSPATHFFMFSTPIAPSLPRKFLLFPLLRKIHCFCCLLGPSWYIASLGLWIITWLSYTLQLIFTYYWVHDIFSFWVWVTSLSMIYFSTFVNLSLLSWMSLFLTAKQYSKV